MASLALVRTARHAIENHDPSLIEEACEYESAAQAPATRRAYAADWRDFLDYCAKAKASALPASPQTVALYVTQLAKTSRIATIRRRLVAIAQLHKERGLESPASHEMVRRVVRGISNTIGSSQTKKSALTVDGLRALLLEVRREDLMSKRDRAIVLLGFAVK